MARFVVKLSSLWSPLLLLGLPVVLGGGVFAWIALKHQPQSLSVSEPLMQQWLKRHEAVAAPEHSSTARGKTLPIPPKGFQPALAIRVMLYSGPDQVLVSNGIRSDSMRCRRGQLTQHSQPLGAQRWFQPAPGQSVGLAEKRYRGHLQLICQGDNVTVVNQVALEDYISSVVGAEMPSHWPAEALKAQAVAARSYAMAHLARPASPSWTLGATTRWQAYGGMSSESRRSRAAAVDTEGLILSLEGGIVESLYASNRQLTVEAHGHLGASMSQHGARALADKGYQFTQILTKYYPGASLARLQRS